MAGIVLRLLILSACLCAASLYAGGGQIRAYNIDYNWDSSDKYINSFAAPGRWADANPKELMRWYEGMGCNAVHSFGVSCNKYAWYKGGKVVPPQPGLKYDLLTEMVKIGKEKNIKVFAYFLCWSQHKVGLGASGIVLRNAIFSAHTFYARVYQIFVRVNQGDY